MLSLKNHMKKFPMSIAGTRYFQYFELTNHGMDGMAEK
jgi:hypothetical protein